MLKPFYQEGLVEGGIDEAGRGSLIGRVYAAVVIWDPNVIEPKGFELKDSKKISRKKRQKIRDYIIENAVDYGVGFCEPVEIDKYNILEATMMAMHRAVEKLTKYPDLLLVDGNRFKTCVYTKENGESDFYNYKCIIKGDSFYKSIAAASILAKVYHDEHIKKLLKYNSELNKYGLLSNMGYGTKKHIEALKQFGPSQFHRMSYKPCQYQIALKKNKII